MSDHFSGAAVLGDPSIDITDFYAFPSPERPVNHVLIMDLFPMATAEALFSDVVTHRFRLRPLTQSDRGVTPGAAEYAIDLTFDDAPAGSIGLLINDPLSPGKVFDLAVLLKHIATPGATSGIGETFDRLFSHLGDHRPRLVWKGRLGC